VNVTLPYWPTHDVSLGNYNMLQLEGGNVSVIQDTYREEAIGYFNTVPKSFNYRKRDGGD
jgi:hypothetical protein